MKIIIFGLGSIGSRHARLLKELPHELFAFRSNPNSEQNSLGIPEIHSLSELGRIKPELAIIANPTDKHIEYATYCAEKGINLFIEKPLSMDMRGVDKLGKLVESKKIMTYIGYDLRFHPAIAWLKEYLTHNTPLHVSVYASSYLPDWRKNVDYRSHYSAISSRGGGVILELSHEIDYLVYLLGEVISFKVYSARAGNITKDAEDFADVLLHFKSKAYASLHIDFLSRLLRREIIMDFEDCTIVADLVGHKITIIKDQQNSAVPCKSESTLCFKIDKDDFYRMQMANVLKSIEMKKPMMNSWSESLGIFELIIKIKKEAKL